MGGLFGHPCPELILRGLVADGDRIQDKKDEDGDDKQLYKGIVSYFIQQAGVAVVVPVGDIGFLTEWDFERRVLCLKPHQLFVQIFRVPAGLSGVQIYKFHDAVLLIGLDDGDGLLAVADEVGEGEVHTWIVEDGLAGGYPQFDLVALVSGDLPGEVF
jgi:hypothetical protein